MLTMMKLVITPDLRLEKRAFRPSFFDGKLSKFGKIIDIFLIGNKAKIDSHFILQT